jgi:hypothetical protein
MILDMFCITRHVYNPVTKGGETRSEENGSAVKTTTPLGA